MTVLKLPNSNTFKLIMTDRHLQIVGIFWAIETGWENLSFNALFATRNKYTKEWIPIVFDKRL